MIIDLIYTPTSNQILAERKHSLGFNNTVYSIQNEAKLNIRALLIT